MPIINGLAGCGGDDHIDMVLRGGMMTVGTF
jgi:hypothetical protein